MNTIELTDEELRIVHAALHAYLNDFGHEEADLLREIKKVLAKLPSPAAPRSSSASAASPNVSPETHLP